MPPPPAGSSLPLLPAVGMALLGACLAALTWAAVARADEQAQEQEQERRFAQIIYEVESRTAQARHVLHGLQGLFAASDQVSRADFSRYARAMEIEQGTLGLQAIQFTRLVPAAERAAYEASVRADTSLAPGGYPQFRITPPGDRPFYEPIDFNEPMRGNEPAFGLDVATIAPRYAVLQAARDANESRASAPLLLAQGTRGGVVLVAPIYRNGQPIATVAQRRAAFMGDVAVVFTVDSLLGAALGNHFGADSEVTLTDLGPVTPGRAATADTPLGRYGMLPERSVWRSPLQATQTLIFAGRFWQVQLLSLPVNPYLQIKSLTAGALVMALTLLALMLASRITAARDRAEALATGLRQTLDQSEARAAALLDATLTGIITLAPDGRIRSANPAAATLFGQADAQLQGLPFSRLVPGVEPASLQPGSTQNVMATRLDGEPLPVAMSVGEVTDGDEPLLLASFHDMSVQKRIEDQQRAFAQAMDDTVRVRTAELTRVNEDLEAFAYSVAHDLRAPVRHVHGFARVIEQHNAAQLDEAGRAHLGRILRASADMGRLIDGLLAFSQLGHRELAPVDVDLGALAQRCMAELEPETQGRTVQWRIGPLPTVRADPTLVAQVMANLLGNAVKYSAGRDPAVIEVSADTSDPAEHRICVADNGIGFDMRYAPQLFKVFSRLHHGGEFEGTGVGLASVQRIVDRHGGRVWVESVPGEGSRFWFALPA